VFQGLGCDDIMYEGQVEFSKHLNLLYDDVVRYYHVITNFTGLMAKKYVCKACHKSCRRHITHVCNQTCSDCMPSPPCTFSDVRIPCDACDRHFRSRTITLTTCRGPQRENPYANVKDVRRVDCLCRGKITNVISDSARTADRTEKQATCVT